jgi:hypothetical protein
MRALLLEMEEREMVKRFRDLKVGERFDWVDRDNTGRNTFFDLCQKISSRKYRSLVSLMAYEVGSINAQVFPR